jgi:hypothetical protein
VSRAGLLFALAAALPFAGAPTARAESIHVLELGPPTAPDRRPSVYVREGLGPAAAGGAVGGLFAATYAFRGGVGVAWDRIAVEAQIGVTGLEGRRRFEGRRAAAVSFGLDGRYHVWASEHVSFYLGGGIHRLDLLDDGGHGGGKPSAALDLGYGGRALALGGGVRIDRRVPLLVLLFPPLLLTGVTCGPKVDLGLYLDVSQDLLFLHHPVAPSLRGHVSRLLVGFSIGT